LAWPKLATAKKGDTGKPAASTTAAGTAVSGLKVTTRSVSPVPFIETVRSTGTLRAKESIDLQVEVSGKVTAISFTEGGKVKKGDLLVKINDVELQASLARATYRHEILVMTEQRMKSLLEDGGVPRHEYDAALNEVNVLKAEIDLAKALIAKTEIRAPFDGEIGLRFVSEGAFITATSNAPTRIATLQSIDQIKVDFSVPEKYGSRIKTGVPVSFSVEDGSKTYHGEIYAIERRVDVTTRTILVRAILPNSDGQLIPGSFANVECPLSSAGSAILVPSETVVPGTKGKTVFVAVDGKAQSRMITVGTRTQSEVQIVDGLAPGDQLIISNIQQLRDGLKVQAVTEKPPANARAENPAVPDKNLTAVATGRRE
jgi:membrane fusion protein (multidrug efflux system)